MKKVYIFLVVAVLITSFSNVVLAKDSEVDNKKIRNAIETATYNWLDTFKSEETPSEKRITAYEMTGYGITYSGEDNSELDVTVNFNITPYLEENTVWETKGNNIGFIRFKKVNGEYEVERISEIPENYEKFLERYEEYKKEHPEILKENSTEKQAISGKEENYKSLETIDKISVSVFIASLALGVFVLIAVFLGFYRKRKSTGE